MTASGPISDDVDPEQRLRRAESFELPIPAPRRAPAWSALPVRDHAAPARGAAVERLLTWAGAGGATWDGIAFRVDDLGNVTVAARRDLGAGEQILGLPRRLMIIDNALAASATGQPALVQPTPSATMATWLALEARAPGSPWRAYLDALPARLDELPMFHGADDLAALEGTAARAIAIDKQREVLAAYGELPDELRARLSLADFAWGYALVMSRAYHAPGTLAHRAAMLPLVELFDHGLGDTTWTYHPLEGFVIRTVRAFAAGDELHFSYGARSNAHLAAYFGFALPDNPADEAALVFERATDPVHQAAAHLLWQLPLGEPARLRVGCVFDERFQRALSVARLCASGPADRARAIETGLTPEGDLPWLGAAVEHAALDLLRAAAERALAAIGSPPSTASAWDQMCTRVRDGERAVLAHLIDFTRRARAPGAGHAPPLLRAYLDAIAR